MTDTDTLIDLQNALAKRDERIRDMELVLGRGQELLVMDDSGPNTPLRRAVLRHVENIQQVLKGETPKITIEAYQWRDGYYKWQAAEPQLREKDARIAELEDLLDRRAIDKAGDIVTISLLESLLRVRGNTSPVPTKNTRSIHGTRSGKT